MSKDLAKKSTEPVTNSQIMDVLKSFQKRFDKSEEANKKWYEEITGIRNDHEKLVHVVASVKKSQNLLSSDVINLQVAVSRLEQHQQNANLLIRGVPESEAENAKMLKEIVSAIFKKVDEAAKMKISSLYRLGSKAADKERTILVKFQTTSERNKVLAAKKKIKISLADVIVNGAAIGNSNKLIFFGEHLCPVNDRIFFVARKLIKKNELVHAWPSNGQIFVRKATGENPIMVSHESQFASVLGQSPVAVSGNLDESTSINQSLVHLEECLKEAGMSARKTRSRAAKNVLAAK